MEQKFAKKFKTFATFPRIPFDVLQLKEVLRVNERILDSKIILWIVYSFKYVIKYGTGLYVIIKMTTVIENR